MIIPFDLKILATTTDGEQGIISTVYVDVIQILTSQKDAISYAGRNAIALPEMRGTIDMIAECGGFCGEGVDEFLTHVLKQLQGWGFVEEVNNGEDTYWVLSPKGLLLKAEI